MQKISATNFLAFLRHFWVTIGLFQKEIKQGGEGGGGVKDMELPVISKKKHVEFPGVN